MFRASSQRSAGSTKTSSNRKPRSSRPSLQPLQPRGEHEQDYHPRCGDRAVRAAAVELHFGQDSGKTDRGQSQRDHQAGSGGAAAARRRAADQPEPAGISAAAATTAAAAQMKLHILLALVALAGPAAAQAPAVDGARAQGAIGERFDGYIGISGPVSG